MLKYMFFTSAVLGILPAVLILACERYLIRIAVLGLILPLVVFNQTAINFFSKEMYRGTSRGFEISIIYIIALILIITFTIIKGIRNPFPDWGSRLYLLYFLLCLPSLTTTYTVAICIFELWKMVMMYLIFIAVYDYLRFSEGDLDIILYGVAIVVVVNFFHMVYQHLTGVYQPRGVFPHQNSMAMFMMIAGLLFFSRYFNNHERFKATIFFIVFGLASVALVRTYSRGALICYPIGATLTVLCSLWHTFSLRKIYVVSLLALIVVGVTLYFVPRVVKRFQSAPEASAQTRRDLAIVARNMIVDKPLRGVGINNWGYAVNPPYTYSEERREKGRFPDDKKDGIVETVYLLIAAECGIPCLVVFLCWLGYYWIVSLRLLKLLRGTPYFYFPAGIIGGLTGVILQSTLEWVLKQQMNFIWLMIVFAAISYLNQYYRKFIPNDDQENAEETEV